MSAFGLVGDERLEPVAVDVGERQLGAGVGDLASHDHPSPGRPAFQVDQVGDLGDLGAVAVVAGHRR